MQICKDCSSKKIQHWNTSIFFSSTTFKLWLNGEKSWGKHNLPALKQHTGKKIKEDYLYFITCTQRQ